MNNWRSLFVDFDLGILYYDEKSAKSKCRPWNFAALVLCTERTEKLSLHRFKRPIAQSQSGVKEIFEIKRVDEPHFPGISMLSIPD